MMDTDVFENKTLDNYFLLVNTLRVKVTTIEQSLSMQRLLSKATLESFTIKCIYTLMTSHWWFNIFVFSLLKSHYRIPLLLETCYNITQFYSINQLSDQSLFIFITKNGYNIFLLPFIIFNYSFDNWQNSTIIESTLQKV